MVVAVGTEETREPLRAVRVALPELGRVGLTDEDGRAVFREVPSGTYRLEASRFGFRPAEGVVDVPRRGVKNVLVLLGPSAVELPGLDVDVPADSWVPGFLHRRRVLEGHFVTKKEIEAEDPARLTQVLREFPEVDVRFDPMGGWRTRLFNPAGAARATNSCRPTLVLNGVPVSGLMSVDDIDPERVIAMEVYWKRSQLAGEELRPALQPREGSGGGPPLSVYGAPPPRDPMDVVRGGFSEGLETRDPADYGPLESLGGAGAGGPGSIMNYCGAIFVWTSLEAGGGR